MNIFEAFLQELQKNTAKKSAPRPTLSAQEVREKLKQSLARSKELFNTLSPCEELKTALSNLEKRAKEPMRIAITGQFSSGKSTFLNALLGQNILPTGITPVTSKLNYIEYGSHQSLWAHYKDGTSEELDIQDLGLFSDQRKTTKDVDFLRILFPLDLLKDITFIDTPGLNSQSQADTTITKDVLKTVDGIIWLSLIDSAGKHSEEQILKEFSSSFSNKSLCVLNQKDKLSKEQIAQAIEYVSKKFDEFFQSVIAISAKNALYARNHDKEVLIANKKEIFIENLSLALNSSLDLDINEKLEHLKKEINTINTQTSEDLQQIMQDSSMPDVLDFINKNIRPHCDTAKEFAISSKTKKIAKSLIEQNKSLIIIYDDFALSLNSFNLKSIDTINQLEDSCNTALEEAHKLYEQILSKIASEFYKNIKQEKSLRYQKEKTLLKEKIITQEYDFYFFDSRKITTNLFEKDEIVKRAFLQYKMKINDTFAHIGQSLENLRNDLFALTHKFKNDFSSYTKKDPLHSDTKTKTLHNFASSVYENFASSYAKEITLQSARIEAKLSSLHIIFGAIYKSASLQSLASLEQMRIDAKNSYEKSPSQFPFSIPSPQEISHILNENFSTLEVQKNTFGKLSFLAKQLDLMRQSFSQIKTSIAQKIDEQTTPHKKELQMLEVFLNT